MAIVNNPGLAEFQTGDIGAEVELFVGDTPAPVTFSAKYSADLAASGIPAHTPVSVNFETDEIVLVDGVAVEVANAITVGVLKSVEGGAAGRMAVYKAGAFNINALNWPASMDDDEKKLAGFDLAACQIFVKKPYYS